MYRHRKEKEEACIIPKGILRHHILMILKDSPLHGYAIIQKIKKETGFWKPSPGAIYPMLSSMEKVGLVKSHNENLKVVYSLTVKGKKHAEKMHDMRDHLRKKGMETLSSIMSGRDFAMMNRKLVEKLHGGKESFEAVNTANSIWVTTLGYFHSRQDTKREDVEKLLSETDDRLRKMLRK